MTTKTTGGPTGVDLEYYYEFTRSDGIGVAATIVLRYGDGDNNADYKLAPPSASGASNGDIPNVRGGNGSWEN